MTMDAVKARRLELLHVESDLFTENCQVCPMIPKNKRFEISRQNDICDQCPVHKKLRLIGEELEVLMTFERALREGELPC